MKRLQPSGPCKGLFACGQAAVNANCAFETALVFSLVNAATGEIELVNDDCYKEKRIILILVYK